MPGKKERRATRNIFLRLGAAASFAAALALLSAGSAAATTPQAKKAQAPAKAASYTMAAADAAGWVVFPGHRAGRVEDLAPSAVKLSHITDPDAPPTPALDWLDRWGSVQVRTAR
jgi:hypothetical protein